MQERNIDAIVAGHVCLDIIPRFPGRVASAAEVFAPGRLINIEEATLATGGPVSNTGIPLSKLGVMTTLMARVGTDEFGQLTRDRLSQSASVEGVVRSGESHSSYTLVIAPPGIDRIFFHSPGTNDTFGAEDVKEELCAWARLFHFGYPPIMRRMFIDEGRELVEVFKKAKQAGATTSLDMALPDPNSEAGRLDWRPIFKKLLPFVDIFHPSFEEGLYMADRETCARLQEQAGGDDMLDLLTGAEHSALSQRLLDWGASVVTLKSGHRGFYVRTADRAALEKMGAAKPADPENWARRELWLPALEPPEGGSATGAGDCSLAGFLAAFLKGETIEMTARCAVSAAWQNLRALDSTSGVGDWEETRRIASDDAMPRLPLDLSAPGWRHDAKRHLWVGPNDRNR